MHFFFDFNGTMYLPFFRMIEIIQLLIEKNRNDGKSINKCLGN
jgi:hypothetical protein